MIRARRQTLVRALLALPVVVLALELGLRWLLFGDPGVLQPFAARFRNELRYAFAMEDDCWKLRSLFSPDFQKQPHTYRDEHLGWTKRGHRAGHPSSSPGLGGGRPPARAALRRLVRARRDRPGPVLPGCPDPPREGR